MLKPVMLIVLELTIAEWSQFPDNSLQSILMFDLNFSGNDDYIKASCLPRNVDSVFVTLSLNV